MKKLIVDVASIKNLPVGTTIWYEGTKTYSFKFSENGWFTGTKKSWGWDHMGAYDTHNDDIEYRSKFHKIYVVDTEPMCDSYNPHFRHLTKTNVATALLVEQWYGDRKECCWYRKSVNDLWTEQGIPNNWDNLDDESGNPDYYRSEGLTNERIYRKMCNSSARFYVRS